MSLGNKFFYGCSVFWGTDHEVWCFLLCFKILLCVVYIFFLVQVLYLNKSLINWVLFTFILPNSKNQGKKNTVEKGDISTKW